MPTQKEYLTVAGRRVPVSNLDKILYPGKRFTNAVVAVPKSEVEKEEAKERVKNRSKRTRRKLTKKTT